MDGSISEGFWKGKTLLVIGGGIMQAPLIKEALVLGLVVVVMDKNTEAIGMQLVEEKNRLVADISQVEQAAESAYNLHRDRRIDRAITVATDFTYTVSYVAKELNLAGAYLCLEDALAASNKIAQRERLAKTDCLQPKFKSISYREAKSLFADSDGISVDDFSKLDFDFDFPMVVKPADSMGARGVKKVENLSDLSRALSEAFSYSRRGEAIVEEYISADEFSIDALIFENQIFITGIADRMIDKPPYFVEHGHVMPSQASGEVIEKIKHDFAKAIRAIGISNGAAKGDIRVDADQQVYIGEIAARLSGGFMSTHTYPYASGVNLMRALLHVSFDLSPEDELTTKWDKKAMDVGILPEAGKVRAICGVEELNMMPWVKDIFLHCAEGDEVVLPKNNVMKAANIIIIADSYPELFALRDKVRSTLKVTVSSA